MRSSALPYWLAFAVALVAVYGGFKLYQVESARYTDSETKVSLPPLAEFELTDQSGQPFRSADMKGKVWVASFFFSTCPGTCARLNANIKYLTTLEELADVTWASITVDPETDTQGVLKAYAESLNANLGRWHFCRSDDFAYIKRVAGDIFKVGGVKYKGHNDFVVVIDKNGKIAGVFNGYNTDDLKKGVALLKQCLAEETGDGKSADAEPAAEAT
jgi:cytochrome oxidase Cu insertion factor (SCO1/SenC/PrrC family)